MTNEKIIAYLLENERCRYQYAKELQKTLRWAILSILACITICACFYMYYVIPVETEDISVSGDNTQAVLNNSLDGGSQLWVAE